MFVRPITSVVMVKKMLDAERKDAPSIPRGKEMLMVAKLLHALLPLMALVWSDN